MARGVTRGEVWMIERFLTRLSPEQLAVVESAVQRWLGFTAESESGQ